MRIQIPTIALFLIVATGCSSQSFAQRSENIDGSGIASSRVEDAQNVSEVSLSVPGSLEITVGREAALRIEGDDNIVEAIVIERHGDELRIKAPRNTSFNPDRPLVLTLGVASLDAVSVAGSGEVETGGVRADDFDASVAGSGTISIDGLEAGQVDISIAGSGDISIDGNADELDLSIAGSGNAQVGDLAVTDADISIAGSGDAFVNVRDHISANIVGSGDVRYVGSPRVEQSVMGSGGVRQR